LYGTIAYTLTSGCTPVSRALLRSIDTLHDAPWYLHKATVPVRNAAYRATDPMRSARGNLRNYRNRRFLETGKGFWVERHTRGLRSSLPVYKNRINPATGRPRADDAEIYGRRDKRLAHARQGGTFDPSRAWERSPDAYHSAGRPALNPYEGIFPYSPGARADAVLGPGRAARAEEALRQAQVNPWAERLPQHFGRPQQVIDQQEHQRRRPR
jgi:hypothetical protein